ncbi:MAG: amino acid ABC transporter permease [Methylobacterium sp.]|nr:amino acid ABC transporter permease [Methylobacterium sp.]
MIGFDVDVIIRSIGYLFREGLTFTIFLTAFAGSLGFAFGVVLALLRNSRSASVRWAASAYVNTIRSLPLVLVIFWIFFLVPFITQWVLGSARPVSIGPVWSALITFTLFEAAYFCEIVRAGLNSVPSGQGEAASALGLNRSQAFMFVVFPQAIRNMLPVLLTQFIILFQDTSLVYVVSITDFLGAAGKVGQRDGRLAEMYIFSAIVYFVICFTLSLFARRLQARSLTNLASAHA